ALDAGQGLPVCASPGASVAQARMLHQQIDWSDKPPHVHALYKDWWTGDLLAPSDAGADSLEGTAMAGLNGNTPRSARLPRRPKERKASEDEDDDRQGVWMVQTADPLEKAEDPMGMQRPADRDQETAAEEYADALSELAEARLVSTPTPAKEVLLSDDPPDKQTVATASTTTPAQDMLHYPEWDYRQGGYRHPGAAR